MILFIFSDPVIASDKAELKSAVNMKRKAFEAVKSEIDKQLDDELNNTGLKKFGDATRQAKSETIEALEALERSNLPLIEIETPRFIQKLLEAYDETEKLFE